VSSKHGPEFTGNEWGYWASILAPRRSKDLWSQNGSCALDTVVQLKDHEDDNLPSFNVEVKNAWRFASNASVISDVLFSSGWRRDGL
jgi:hypothetical protein